MATAFLDNKAKFVVTTAPGLQKVALREMRRVSPGLEKSREFLNGILLVEVDVPACEFVASLVRTDPVFVKHIMPAQVEVALTGNREVDLPLILEAAQKEGSIGKDDEFSVQCRRMASEYGYTAKDVEVFVGSTFEAKGARPTFSDCEVRPDEAQTVVSIFLYRDTGYVGCSTVRENLNEHSDEYRVFSRRVRQVNRAEYKLREAVRKFGLDISGGRALDLGAAPGGWTGVLAEAGMEVVALDPSALDERVEGMAAVRHIRSRAEDYDGEGEFDLLVNDMNIDPEVSAAMMVRMARCLKPRAMAVMTCKLVVRAERLLGNVAPVLESAYETLRIKHLFHNRSEVTMLLRKR